MDGLTLKGNKVNKHKVGIKPVNPEILTMSHAEWWDKGKELFGEDFNKWRFVCAHCGEVQTMEDFAEAEIEKGNQKVFFSCIGREVVGRGCDWTLGGFFQIHTAEVIKGDGTKVPVFRFDDNAGKETTK